MYKLLTPVIFLCIVICSLLYTTSRILEQGQIAIVDESFEQELWYMGAKPSLFLTVDVWHPDLTQETIKKLGPLS